MWGQLRTSVKLAKIRWSASDYSLDPSAPQDDSMIRAVPLDSCLACWGTHFSRAANRKADFHLSQKADVIDHFLSHDWKTPRFDKFLALIWTFNCKAAMVATAIVSCLVGVVRISLDATLGSHWSPVGFGYLTFAFTLCFWQRMRSCCCKPRKVFLDRLCIDQEDEEEKRRGILGLPSFLHSSEQLTILWSPRWNSRLWCLFELATFIRMHPTQTKPIRLVPVKIGRIILSQMLCCLLVQLICWVSLEITGTFTHSGMMDLLSPDIEINFGDENLQQVRQQLFEFYLVMCSIFGIMALLILPSFTYMGQVNMKDLANLPVQLSNFRVQDCECFCCSNSHRDPTTGETLQCDRLLVHRMLAKWFSESGETEDDLSYLDGFNTVVRDELSLVMASASGSTLRFRDAFCAAWGCTLPWISDFIPWWANSELRGLSFFLWFLRGFMLWSYNGLLMMIMMQASVILWKVSLNVIDCMPVAVLVVAQVAALLAVALCVWLPFRWWFVTTDDLSLWPSVPYLGAVLLALCLFRCQCGVLRPPAQSQPVTPDGPASPSSGDVDLQSPPLSPTVSLERLDESDPTFRESF